MTILGFSPALHPIFEVVILTILVLLATLRLTRLVTTDDIGEWFLRGPLLRWAKAHERRLRHEREQSFLKMLAEQGSDPAPDARAELEELSEQLQDEDQWIGWQGKLVSGLYCPHCIGFWLGAVVVVLTVVLMPLSILGTIWLAVLSILALSYVVGHLSARLD